MAHTKVSNKFTTSCEVETTKQHVLVFLKPSTMTFQSSISLLALRLLLLKVFEPSDLLMLRALELIMELV